MPTVIDSLVISLGLDPAKFISGQKDAAASMAKTKDAALKQSSELETANKKFAESFNLVKRQAAEFFALITVSAGIKSFVTDITNATAALGRLSVNLGVAPQEMSEWGLAIERVGGQASEASSDFQELSKQLFDIQQNGKNIPVGLQRLGGFGKIDYNHGIPEYLTSIGKAVEAFQRKGGSRSDAFNFLKEAGIGPGMAQLLLDHGSAIDKFVGSLKNLAPTDDQIKKFEALQTAFITLQQKLVAFGRDVVADFATPVQTATETLGKFLEQNRKLVEVNAFSWLKTIRDDAQAVVDVLNKIVDVENWLAAHSLGGMLANKIGPQSGGNGQATPIPWGEWGGKALKWFGDNWGIKGAQGADFGPGFGQGSHPHPASGLFIQGQQVSRGNPMPVTIVAGTETGGGGGFLSWLFGGGSPTMPSGGSTTSQGGGAEGGGIVKRITRGIHHALFGGGGDGGSSSGSFIDALAQIESSNSNIYSKTDPDVDGPNSRSQGYFQINTPTWRDFAGAAGIDLSKYPNAMSAPRDVQAQVASVIPLKRFGPRTRRMLESQFGFGPEQEGQTIGTFAHRFGGGVKANVPTGGMSPAGGPWVKSGGREYASDKDGNIIPSISRGGLGDDPSKHSRGLSDPINPSFGPSWAAGKFREGIFDHNGYSGPHNRSRLSTMSALHPVTTSSTSNSMHIDQIHVNAPNATNAHGIADRISDALRSTGMTTTANFGQA